jgi:hypothetical protein
MFAALRPPWDAKDMHRVEITLQRHELAEKMAEMRVWLDEHRCEPSVFTYYGYGSAIFVQLAFREAAEATAFADRFVGRMAAAA